MNIGKPNGRAIPIESRFWRRVTKQGPDECWNWTGARDRHGYGVMPSTRADNWKPVLAHRVSYQIATGTAPGKLHVLHSCNNPSCVNPAHLRLGTHAENMQDRRKAGNDPIGERNGFAKISDAEVSQIRVAAGTQSEVAARFGVCQATVHNIRHGKLRRTA